MKVAAPYAPLSGVVGMRPSSTLRILAASATLALLLTACGEDDDDGGTASGDSNGEQAAPLQATRSGDPFAEPTRLEAEDGRLRFDLVAADKGIKVAGTE